MVRDPVAMSHPGGRMMSDRDPGLAWVFSVTFVGENWPKHKIGERDILRVVQGRLVGPS